jgi:hypothetical protein
MAMSEDGLVRRPESSASRPPVPFEQGKELGLKGSPISPEVVTLFREFHAMPGRALDPELSRVFVANKQEVPEEVPDTEAQRRAAAYGFVKGYEDGLGVYLLEPLSDDTRRLSIHEMATLHPSLVSASPNGLEAYVTGHNLQRPAHLDDGEVYKGNISVADAHKLGFIVRAATLETRVEQDEIPVTKRDWQAFESGMARGTQTFSQLVREVAGDSALFQRLVDMNMLGVRMDMAIQRIGSRTNPAV